METKMNFWQRVEVGDVPIIGFLATIPWWIIMSPLLLAMVIDWWVVQPIKKGV